jgi:Phage integrase family
MVGISPPCPTRTCTAGPSPAPATWNRQLATLRAAVGWWRHRGWLALDPTDALERRRQRIDRTKALTRGQLERLLARRDLPLRERTRWRLLYETTARANERLALDVADLDLANPRARVHSKGGAVEWVFWPTGSAQLLLRLLTGRTSGPVFLAAAGPLPARLGALPGALCPPRAGGGRPPPRRHRPGTPPTLTHPHHIWRPALSEPHSLWMGVPSWRTSPGSAGVPAPARKLGPPLLGRRPRPGRDQLSPRRCPRSRSRDTPR